MYTFFRWNVLLKLGILITCSLLLGPFIFSIRVVEKQFDISKRLAHDKLQTQHSLRVADVDVANPETDVIKTTDNSAVYRDNVIGNFEQPHNERRTGPGEYGKAVITPEKDERLVEEIDRQYGYNLLASDNISLDRAVPDLRMDECKFWHYPETLPVASVILVVFNEGWSTLLRTIHSVINTSPKHLLKEVLVIDDVSDKEHLKAKLEDYIKRWNGKVKLYRNEKRKGLIQSRTAGARLATGEVVVFLDAHCECGPNWLPPLLTRIAYNRTIVAVPIIDYINWKTFSIKSVYRSYNNRGLFEWGFFYKEGVVPPDELSRRKYDSEPYRSPTHAGGLLAIDKRFFFELGGYDPGLLIWGGENFELSFKVWMCGGSIEWVPCSHVGHVYKHRVPSRKVSVHTKIPYTRQNYLRIVEVWLDDVFKEYFYTRMPWLRGYPLGDLSKQLQIKKDRKCKSFKWYMDNIAYDVYYKFPPPPRNRAWGQIKLKHELICWSSARIHHGMIKYKTCRSDPLEEELFRLNVAGEIGSGELCINVNDNKVIIKKCDLPPSGPWEWHEKTGAIFHKEEKKCVELGPPFFLEMKPCNPAEQKQNWTFVEIYPWKMK